MIILTLELKGYNRLRLRGIGYVKYTPKSLMQLIIGSNGSGKSSLFKELSPLPANKSEFTEPGKKPDGYKTIEIENNGHHYLLQSIFTPNGDKFHFIKNGEELNEGHTITVYRDLCRIEFGITGEIHSFLLGEKSFTGMRGNERRTHLMSIADTDYTYAVKYYKSLSGKLRDISGAIKITKAKIQQETAKRITVDEEQILRREVAELKEELSKAISDKPRVLESYQDVERSLNNNLATIASLLEAGKRLRTVFSRNTVYSSPQHAEDSKKDLEKNIASDSAICDYLANQLMDKQRQMEDLKELAGKNLDKYLDERVELRRSFTTMISGLKTDAFRNLKEIDKVVDLASSCRDTYVRLVSELPANRDGKYTKASWQFNSNKKTELESELHKRESRISELNVKIEDLEHKRNHPDTVCPNCKHSWKFGFDSTALKIFVEERDKLALEIGSLKEEIETISKWISDCTDYFRSYLAYKNYVAGYPQLELLWSEIESTGAILNTPESIGSVYDSLFTELENIQTIERLKLQLEENQKWVTALEAQKNAQNNDDQSYSELEAKYSELLSRVERNNRELAKAEEYILATKQLEKLCENIQKALEYQKNRCRLISDSTLAEFMNEIIMILNRKLAEKETALSRVNVQNGVLLSLEQQLESLESDRYLLDLAVKELSPSSGLIAKGLIGFINHFIIQMNSFMRKIWTYPIEMKLISMDDDNLDLDYEFPVLFNDTVLIDDISKGSSAQKEIINLAHRIVAMAHMGMSNWPLWLDEFGAKFDSGHRHMAFSVITNIIANAGFSQIFMISHDENSYGSLQNCDISVLCDANVVVPEGAVINKQFIMR